MEVEVGTICANLPHLRPLFLKWFTSGGFSATGTRNTGRSSVVFRSFGKGEGPEGRDDRRRLEISSGGPEDESRTSGEVRVEIGIPLNAIKVETILGQTVERRDSKDKE